MCAVGRISRGIKVLVMCTGRSAHETRDPYSQQARKSGESGLGTGDELITRFLIIVKRQGRINEEWPIVG